MTLRKVKVLLEMLLAQWKEEITSFLTQRIRKAVSWGQNFTVGEQTLQTVS